MNYSPNKSTLAVVEYLLELDRHGVVGFEAIKNAVSDRTLRTEVRDKAITFLQFLGDRTVCKSLVAVILDTEEDWRLRSNCAVTLGMLSCRSEIEMALEIFQRSGDDKTRICLIRSFWWAYTYGAPCRKLIDAMFACVCDAQQPQEVRAEAATALGNMLPSGRRASDVFIGLINTLAVTRGSDGAHLQYQLVYAIAQIAHSVRRSDNDVKASLPILVQSLERLLQEQAVIDGETLGQYACETLAHLHYMGMFEYESAAEGELLWGKQSVN